MNSTLAVQTKNIVSVLFRNLACIMGCSYDTPASCKHQSKDCVRSSEQIQMNKTIMSF